MSERYAVATLPAEARVSLPELPVGSLVVYGGYGVGRVSGASSPDAGDGPGGSIVLEFSSGLSVTLPADRANACLRPVCGEGEVARVADALRSQEIVIESSWQARTRGTKSKISAGEAVGLAEVVRDAVRRERAFPPGKSLSSYERELYLKARRLLAAELGASTGNGDDQAEAWIDAQLA